MMRIIAIPLLFSCKETPKQPKDNDTSNDTGVVEELSYCETLGLQESAFQDNSEVARMRNLVNDFQIETTEGLWSLSESWTGCDSYLFFNYHPDYEYPVAIWNSSFEDLLLTSPPNVHYFFASFNTGSEEIEVTALQERFDQELLNLDESLREHWKSHIHFVTESIWTAQSVGDLLQYRADFAFGINRQQRYAEVGYMSMPGAYDWESTMETLAFEAQHYNYLSSLEEEIRSYESTVVPSFDGERISSAYIDFDMPSSDEMKNYDTLHMELNLGCGDPYYEDCGEWDYLIYAYLCSEEIQSNPFENQECQAHVPETIGICTLNEESTETQCRSDEECVGLIVEESDVTTCIGYETEVLADTQTCSCSTPLDTTVESSHTCNEEGTGYGECNCPCDTEIGRWITSYARDGHWTMDASPLLSMFKKGGNQTIRFQSSYGYDNTLNFHLSNTGKNGTPQEIIPLFSGGSFNENYNAQYEAKEIEIPSNVTRTEIYAVISGHGWGSEVENCAEFCNHTHHFTVNGSEFVKEHPQAGQPRGCVDQIPNGTTPNQYGTWPYGRGGWCPGMQVDPWIVDVTDNVQAGETTTITYKGLFEGENYVPVASNSGQGFGANIKMKSYLVLYW